MAEEQKQQTKKKDENARQPSAQKRNIQSQKRRLRNREHRSSVLTAIRALEEAIVKKEPSEQIANKLNRINSLMDRGVKKGVYTVNKAARTKSRLLVKSKSV